MKCELQMIRKFESMVEILFVLKKEMKKHWPEGVEDCWSN